MDEVLYDIIREICINDLSINKDNIVEIITVFIPGYIDSVLGINSKEYYAIQVKILGKIVMSNHKRSFYEKCGCRFSTRYFTNVSTSQLYSYTLGFDVTITNELEMSNSVD